MTDARQLIDELTALGVKIELHDGKIKFGPKSKVTPELLLKMREERNQLIEFLEREPQAIAVAQNAGALNEQVAFSDVEFGPAFFLNHRYAGRGSIEVKSDTVIISAKRLWRSRGKQVAVILPVFIVFAFLGCILGLVPLLLVYTLV